MYRMWTDNFLGIQERTKAVFESIKSVFEDAMWYVQRIMGAFRLAQEGDWYAFGQKIREVWDNLWLWIKDTVAGIVDSILAAFDIDWASVGRNIIDGIKSGVVNAANDLAEAAKQAAQNALDAVKGFLGIDSPSKVFAEIGANISQGMAKGITGETAPVQAIKQTAGTMTTAAAGAGGGNNYNFYITGGDPETIAQKVLNEIKYRMK